MSVVCAHAECSRRLPVRFKRRGRPMLYCSAECRRSAEYAVRRNARTFNEVRREFLTEGEDAVRARAADDPAFAEQLRLLAETFLKPPDGRGEVDIDPEVLDLLLVPAQTRRFSVIGHDNPLPSSALIDEAEQTGDWTRLLKESLKDMSWQLAKGFKPDLRGFDLA